MSNESKFSKPQTNQRLDSISIGSDRISTRIVSSTRGSTFSVNSITSADGIPIGVFRGTKIKRKWKVAQKAGRVRMKLIKYHPICVLWFTTLIVLGIILQVVIK